MQSLVRKLLAVGIGLTTHVLFLLGVGWMTVSLFFGVQTGLGRLHGAAAWLANGALALQFPLLHSALLSVRGRRLLARAVPFGLGADLSTTTYAAFASVQLLVTFGLWSPSGIVWWMPHGAWLGLSCAAYAASWALLGKAMSDAGLSVQTGSLGWTSVVRNRPPRFPAFFPERGLFRLCRQPVYLAFALTLWTGPWASPDRLLLAVPWTLYCVLGPGWKERRYVALYGERYRSYQRRVPYWMPSPGALARAVRAR